MSKYAFLKSQIATIIRNNGNREITGDKLQTELFRLIDATGNVDLVGKAMTTDTPSPVTSDAPVMYLAGEKGTFTNFGGVVVTEDICFIMWDGDSWSKIGKDSLQLGEAETTAYRGDRGKIAYDHSQSAHAPSNANYYDDAMADLRVASGISVKEESSNKTTSSTPISAESTDTQFPTSKAVWDFSQTLEPPLPNNISVDSISPKTGTTVSVNGALFQGGLVGSLSPTITAIVAGGSNQYDATPITSNVNIVYSNVIGGGVVLPYQYLINSSIVIYNLSVYDIGLYSFQGAPRIYCGVPSMSALLGSVVLKTGEAVRLTRVDTEIWLLEKIYSMVDFITTDVIQDRSGNGISVSGVRMKDGWINEYPKVQVVSGVPDSTPVRVGDLYVDTLYNKLYFAIGTNSSSDWQIVTVDVSTKEDISNKVVNVVGNEGSDVKFPTTKAVFDYVSLMVSGVLHLVPTGYDASVNTFPTVGTGEGGSIRKGDFFVIIVGGTLGSKTVSAGNTIIAGIDGAGNTESEWIISNTSIAYTPEDVLNKVTSLSSSNTDIEYPSAKAVYEALQLVGVPDPLPVDNIIEKTSGHGVQIGGMILKNYSIGYGTPMVGYLFVVNQPTSMDFRYNLLDPNASGADCFGLLPQNPMLGDVVWAEAVAGVGASLYVMSSMTGISKILSGNGEVVTQVSMNTGDIFKFTYVGGSNSAWVQEIVIGETTIPRISEAHIAQVVASTSVSTPSINNLGDGVEINGVTIKNSKVYGNELVATSWEPGGTNYATAQALDIDSFNQNASTVPTNSSFYLPQISDKPGTVYVYNGSSSTIKVYGFTGDYISNLYAGSGSSQVTQAALTTYKYTSFKDSNYWIREVVTFASQASPYKVYTAKLNVSGSGVTPVILQNTIGNGSGDGVNDISWSIVNYGSNNGIVASMSTHPFTYNKTKVIATPFTYGDFGSVYQVIPEFLNANGSYYGYIRLDVMASDGTFNTMPYGAYEVEIRVYN